MYLRLLPPVKAYTSHVNIISQKGFHMHCKLSAKRRHVAHTLFFIILLITLFGYTEISRADSTVKWENIPGTVRAVAAYDKYGTLVDTRVNIGIRYTNTGNSAVKEISDRHVWYEGEIEVTPKEENTRTIEFLYDEEYPGIFEANLKPGASRTRNYVILLSADGVIKDYDVSAKYRVKSLRAVKHKFNVVTQ